MRRRALFEQLQATRPQSQPYRGMSPSSIYPPAHPPNTQVLSRIAPNELSKLDRLMVVVSSLTIVGSVAWVPLAYAWAWRRWCKIPKDEQHRRRRTVYATLLISLVAIAVVGPHRSHRLGKFFQIKQWNIWKAWLRFVAFEVVADTVQHPTENSGSGRSFDLKKDQAIFAIIPHGLFPFGLGFAVLTEAATKVFGEFRPVVATATSLFPFLRTILSWIWSVDAARSSVEHALSQGHRIGLAPGGIAEMFVGYPAPSTHPDEEYAILKPRKGFIRMAVKHNVPVVPVYCFGATKLLKRLQLPAVFERMSNLLRVSIVVFFGAWGLPVPFRQRLMYVVGQPIFPPGHRILEGSPLFDEQVDQMHTQFCEELKDLFDRHKESYGWQRKTLRLV